MKYLLILLFFLSFAFEGTSQVITEAEMTELLNSQEIQVDNPMISNFLTIQQISDDNSATSIQNNPGVAGNTVMITQDGIGNTGYVNQNGSGNETRLWQYNSSNEASLWTEGNNITTLVKQDGEGNVINSHIKNYQLESRTAMLIQEGSENSITLNLREDGIPGSADSQEFRITQNGNGHSATIAGDEFDSPITINQTSGAGGTGMQIEINTSYFSFLMGN